MASEKNTSGNHQNRDLFLEELLIEVAQEFEDADAFREAASKVAGKVDYIRAQELTRYFHNYPPEPEALKAKTRKYGILGVWMGICQDAVFEILYNYKEQAIPALYKIGFGEYDWTQYKAIAVLCMLAKEGIQTEEIISNIGKNIQDFRYEATFPSIEALSGIPGNNEVSRIIITLFDNYSKYDPIDGLYILKSLALHYPDEVRRRLAFVKSIAQGKGIENRSPFLDGALATKDAEGNETFFIGGKEIEGNFEEVHKIHAAVFYYTLDKTDIEINALIDFWENHAKEESHRKIISDLKKGSN